MAKHISNMDYNAVYEGVVIGDSILTVHGKIDVEQEIHGDMVIREWEEFIVVKCFIEYEFDDKTFYFEASTEFVQYLNKHYGREIARQALEADYV